MPRLWLGIDDEFVVKVAWEGLEVAKTSWEAVSCVLEGATVVLRKYFKALRLKMDQWRGLVQQYRRQQYRRVISRIVFRGGSRILNC